MSKFIPRQKVIKERYKQRQRARLEPQKARTQNLIDKLQVKVRGFPLAENE